MNRNKKIDIKFCKLRRIHFNANPLSAYFFESVPIAFAPLGFLINRLISANWQTQEIYSRIYYKG